MRSILKKIKARQRKNKKRRVVITGIGVVSPIGIGIDDFWKNLLAGKTGMGEITLFDPSSFPSRIAAEVKNFDPLNYLSRMQVQSYSRASQFACSAVKLAIDDGSMDDLDPYRTDVIIGSAVSSLDIIEKEALKSPTYTVEYKPGVVNPLSILKAFISAPASAVALMLKSKGYVTTVSSACSSGINAIGLASQRIIDGHSDTAVAGGVDTPITRFVLHALCDADFLSTKNENPEDALCPFDLRHSKSALGEGAAMFILEEYNQAVSRRAKIYGEILDFAQQTENINELFMIDNQGENWAETISNVLKHKNTNKPDHIDAHGPSDSSIDKIETIAIKKALGKKAYKSSVSSIKGSIGSSMSAAGALQIASASMALYTGKIPPNYNYKISDPDCDLKHPAKMQSSSSMNHILVNSHGLGGNNASLLLKRFFL